jgi:hypothetical protein
MGRAWAAGTINAIAATATTTSRIIRVSVAMMLPFRLSTFML